MPGVGGGVVLKIDVRMEGEGMNRRQGGKHMCPPLATVWKRKQFFSS